MAAQYIMIYLIILRKNYSFFQYTVKKPLTLPTCIKKDIYHCWTKQTFTLTG
jgi:hypothetical protein